MFSSNPSFAAEDCGTAGLIAHYSTLVLPRPDVTVEL